MPIVVEATYRKTLGLPNFSSHSFSVSLRVECADPAQAEAEARTLYARLQRQVDADLQRVGFLPGDTYGLDAPPDASDAPDAYAMDDASCPRAADEASSFPAGEDGSHHSSPRAATGDAPPTANGAPSATGPGRPTAGPGALPAAAGTSSASGMTASGMTASAASTASPGRTALPVPRVSRTSRARPTRPNADGWACSQKQTDLIVSLVSQYDLDKRTVDRLARKLFDAGVKTLDRAQASQLIDELLRRYRTRPDVPPPPPPPSSADGDAPGGESATA